MKAETTQLDVSVKLTPKPDAEDGVYLAHASFEGCDHEDGHLIGEAHTIGPGRWAYYPSENVTRKSGGDDAIEFEADGVEAAADFLQQKTGAIDIKIPSDRLQSDTMAEHVYRANMGLQSLAVQTDSMPGYIRGLCQSLAAVMADDIKAEKLDEFLADFIKNARVLADERREKTAQMQAMKSALKEGGAKGLAAAIFEEIAKNASPEQ